MSFDEPTSWRLRLPIEPGRSGAGAAVELSDVVADALHEVGIAARSAAEFLAAGDAPDSAVWRVSEETGIVVAVEGFPPPLADPVVSGEITAVHTLATLAAMGGEPYLALATVGLPPRSPRLLARSLLRGAARAIEGGGAVLTGGHAVRMAGPYLGLAVVGRLDPLRRLRPDGARPGDHLVVTKPLGTGLILAGQTHRLMRDTWLAAALEVMTRLDQPASEIAGRHRLTGAVRIGGSGLLGAAATLARAGRSRVVLRTREFPALPGALELAAAGVEDEAAARVRESVAPILSLDLRLDPLLVALAADPATAGGLLLAVPPTRREPLLQDLGAAGFRCRVVGGIEASAHGEVVLA